MREQCHFQSGQSIILREIWKNRIWSARPAIVVQDEPELMAFYIPNGTICKEPKTLAGNRVTVESRVRSEWILEDEEWSEPGRLKLIIPDTSYSVLIFWNAEGGSQRLWYINLEDPIQRTSHGYDYIDQLLDIIATPDLSEWHWKDEDELEEAVITGLITPGKAATMRVISEQVVNWLQSGQSPFNGWENWQPDSSWQIPILPDGWDTV
jgi:predicted RNA-binding protein associated with RNAse of E/G family